MKRVISSTSLSQGSYLVDRLGRIQPVILHVPSTTYVNRGIMHLCPTDANFFVNDGMMSNSEAVSVLVYCILEWMDNHNVSVFTVKDSLQFRSYAELQYAPIFNRSVVKFLNNSKKQIVEFQNSLPDFESVNNKFYNYALNEYCKLSILGNMVEFRIGSEDGFNWNSVIIDEVILKKGLDQGNYRFTISRESSKGYKLYFSNATLDELLSQDKTVMSSTAFKRTQTDDSISYSEC